jgi:hypothetical protein
MGDMADMYDVGADLADQHTREDQWNDGFHNTRMGIIMKISSMSDAHLHNTIEYFQGYDTSALARELEARKTITNPPNDEPGTLHQRSGLGSR